MVLSRFVPTLFLLSMVAACSSPASTDSLPDVRGDSEAPGDGPLAADSSVLEVGIDSLAEPLHGLWYSGFSQPGAGTPSVFITTSKINGPNLVTFFVKAGNLGQVAGVAFYLRYDSEYLRFDNAKSVVNFGDSGPYFTASAAKELTPGLVTFGAARFCKDKIPWGSTDQCGGIDIGEKITLASFTFEIVGSGTGSLRFPEANTLLLRPDRTTADAAWIGGSYVIIDEVQP